MSYDALKIMNRTIKYRVLMITFVVLLSIISLIGSSNIGLYAQTQGDSETSNINATQSGQTTNSVNLNNLLIEHAGGGFTSLQTDNDSITWITSGKWDLLSTPSVAGISTPNTVIFNATIDMRTTNNSGGHAHKVYDFKLTDGSIVSDEEGSVLIFDGTSSVETPFGLYTEVPINIKIMDGGPAIVSIDSQSNTIKPKWIPKGGTISLSIDEQKVDDHFGSTSIYGNVRRE